MGEAVTRNFWFILLSFAALVALSFTGRTAAIVCLGLAALLVAGVMISRRPRGLAWRLATVGAVAWGIEEAAWSVTRLSDVFTPSFVTEVGYYLGAAAWLAALLTAPGRRLPRSLLLAAIPPVALVVWMLVDEAASAASLVFPMVELALLLAALPLLGGTIKAGASEGRLLLVFGFFFRALAAAAYAWLAGGTDSDYLFLWQLSYVCLGLGIYMELKDVHVDFVSAGVAVVTLQLAAARVLAFIYANPGARTGADAVAVVGSLAFLQLAVVIVILINNNERHMKAHREHRTWSALLEHSMGKSADGATLGSLMDRTLRMIPGLQGIEVHPETGRGVLAGYPYPLVAGGAEVGRLFFQRQPDATSALDTSAPLLAARIEQVREHDRWRTAALTDPLTNLLNRRGLELRAPGLLSDARRLGSAVSIGLIDIDHFKRVNDVYGHTTGDMALKELAAILQRHLRPNDLAVRWGGEEFLVVLVTDLPGALDAMRRLRRELAGATIGPVAWPLAASVGLAGGTVPASDEVLSEWIELADAALLKAKAQGRNRIESSQAQGAVGD